MPSIASKINNRVIYYFPYSKLFHSVSLFTKIVGITNPNPPIAVDIKVKSEVTKVRWFSFHQIEDIFAEELNNIGWAVAANNEPIITKKKLLLIKILIQALNKVNNEANTIANFIFFYIIKLAGIFSRNPVKTKESEQKVIIVSLILYA